jgi:hypothetical protein
MYFTKYNHIYRNTNTLSDFSRLNILSTSARAGVYLGEFCSVEIQASQRKDLNSAANDIR